MIDLYHENTQAPFLSVNEWKAIAGLEPSEGGDVYLTNANARIVEKYSDFLVKTEDDSKTTDEPNVE